MSYNSHQLHYYNNNHPFTPSDNLNKTSTTTSLQGHQEQLAKLSPGKFSLSPVSSPSSSLYASRAISLNKTSAFSEAVFVQDDDDDNNQPLDLSIHTSRDELTLKRAHADEHKPVCLVKSCTCNLSNPKSHHLSRYCSEGKRVIRSPNPRLTLSPLTCTDAPKHQMTNSAYNRGFINSAASPPNYLSQELQWASAENSTFQLLTTSDHVLNGAQIPSSLFRPYDDHIEQDINMRSQEQQLISPNSLTLQNDNENDGPTYMDLDSPTTDSFNSKPTEDYAGNSSFLYSKLNLSQSSSTQNRNAEGRMEVTYSPRQSTLLQALNSGVDCASSEVKTAACFVGGVISHTSLEKYQKVSSPSSSVSPISKHAGQQNPNQQQQMHFQQLSSSSSEAAPTNHSPFYSLQPNTPSNTAIQTKHSEGHIYSSHASDDLIYSKDLASQQQFPSSGNLNLDQPGRKSPSDKGNISRNKSNIRPASSTTTNCIQLPVSTTTNGIVKNKNRRAGEDTEVSSGNQTEPSDNENSTKISLLDFWISKILMERSSEAPVRNKPCNVDYICTANGEKKIRLRLVDLMELQVEQSLKA